MTADSLAHCIEQLEKGDEAAAQKVWERFFPRLVQLARIKLGATPKRLADEEDVVLSAMKSFFDGAQQGCFPELDRDNLWFLLAKITARKCVNARQRELAKKRGGGGLRGESVFAGRYDESYAGIGQVAGAEPTPEFLTAMDENLRELLSSLRDDTLRRIALWRMEGYSNAEVANELGVTTRSIERKLSLIRKKWSKAEN